MDSYIIQVQPREELTAIIDKIMNTHAERVYLLVSENSLIAQHALNFRLLKREAESLGKEIIIVSSSPQVQNLALRSSLQAHAETHELKEAVERDMQEDFLNPPRILDVLPAAPSIEAPRQEVKDAPTKTKAIDAFWHKQNLKEAASLEVFSKVFRRGAALIYAFCSSQKNLRGILFILMGITAIIGGVTFYSILPRARIDLTPLTEEVTLEMQLTADISASVSDARSFLIPGQIFEKAIEETRELPVKGEKEIKRNATGTIKVYNAYSSSPQTLVGTTRFISEDGKLFRTIDTITVPGAEVEDGKIIPSFATVKVAAAEPGEGYNIGPSSFSIPGFKGTAKYLGFYGKSEESMEGGRVGIVKVVSESDYNSAKDALLKDLTTRAEQEVSILLPQGFFTPSEARHISEVQISSSSQIGDMRDELVLKGTTSIKVFAFHKQEVLQMFESDFASRFPEKKLSTPKDEVDYEVIKLDLKKGTMQFKASAQRKAHLAVDTEEILAGVRGKNEEEVRSFLGGVKTIKEAKVTFWPFWVSAMPSDQNRIEVTVGEGT